MASSETSGYGREEALAFIDAMRLTLTGKVGFSWLAEKLSDLSAYIDSITAENEQLNAYVDRTGAREAFETFRSADD